MNEGQVIAFTEIVNRQLPVAFQLQREARILTAGIDRLLKLFPALHQLGIDGLKRLGIAVDVDEHNIAPAM